MKINAETKNSSSIFFQINSLLFIISDIFIEFIPTLIVYVITTITEFNSVALSFIFIFYLLSMISNNYSNRKNEIYIQILSERNKHRLISKALRLDYEMLQDSDIRTKIDNCIFMIDNQSLYIRYYETIITLMSSISVMIITFLIVGNINIIIILITIVIAVVSAIINNFEKKYSNGRTSRLLKVNKGLNYYESILKKESFQHDNAIYGYSDMLSQHYQSFISKVNKALGSNSIVMGILKSLRTSLSASSYVIGSLILINSATQGYNYNEISVAVVALFTLIGSLGKTFEVFSTLTVLQAQLNSINEVLQFSPKILRDAYNTTEYAFVLENVHYSYRDGMDVLSNVSFKIKKGETIALVGENGSGKSTLIGILAGVLQPEIGKLYINDELKTSFVQQRSIKLPDSIRDNVIIESEYNQNKMKTSLSTVNLYEYIQTLDYQDNTLLDKQINQIGVELSNGEFQRLTIARGLYKNADILILDEPTASLDILNEYQIFAMVNDLIASVTKIFVTHRLANAQKANRIIYLEQGKVCEEGTHLELMRKKGKYYQLFMKQSELYTKID